MSTEARTAHVNVFAIRSIEVDEPDWCAGHPDSRAQFKADVTHFGPEHIIPGPDGGPLLTVMFAQSPYSERSTTAVELHVEVGDIDGSRTPEEVDQLADALVAAAGQLRTFGRELARILAGGGV
ncbi:hypothetical protein [Streptomyces sp. NPDC048663]|uniref:DUF6907 domain-containing protein n=1 Tax=Streptomyces sp. NPDC048663 TaxID=3155638 RepID=UPI00342F785E